MRPFIWEYAIYFKNGEEVFTESESEYKDIIEDRDEEIENIYLKKWVWDEDREDYFEDYCEVIK